MPIGTINPAEAVDQGVRHAYERDGYLQPDGIRDLSKVRERVTEILCSRRVLNHNERTDKATTRASMVEQVFPALPGPEAWEGQSDPQLAQAVWKKIDSFLWSACSPGAASAVQRLVGVHMGNGYILCRTLVGRDRVSAAYVTADIGCIERDFVRPTNDSLAAKIESVRADRELLIMRQPDSGRRWVQGFDRNLRALAQAAHEQLTLTLESASAGSSAESEDDGEE